ncbi:peptidase M23 [Paenibacillus thermoaerophilus]|nr:peptidase M23 [Paenibacillus thermoaerophilus]
MSAGLAAAAIASAALPSGANAAESKPVPKTVSYAERKAVFEEIGSITGIPWNYLAAIDQYERALSLAMPKKRPLRQGLTAIQVPAPLWAGPGNPNQADTSLATISLFGGIGRDGNGDGVADPSQDLDVLSSMASYLTSYGLDPADFRVAVWQYYGSLRSVERIEQFAGIYKHFGTLDLHRHAFPLPLGSNYSYRSTWGASRSWGGFRIHEGTDLFAPHGVPVRSTCYGVVEVIGWNPYGGWRIGIRDPNGVYHYYAHLAGYVKPITRGDYVQPGQVIGYVGSSGYGKPGTSGKFPPHLHYGTYRDNGFREWSFDPYPHLSKWEREERAARRAK